MIPIDNDFLTQTLVDLVRIDSSNPSLSIHGAGEAEIGAYVAGVLQALGLEVHLHELAPGRVNVVGILPGAGWGRSLMWNAHMDTVGVEGMPAPFSGEVRNGRLYGRGSQDMKGSLAAMLAAAKALVDAGVELGGDLILTGVADEEFASLGTADILRRYRADAAIVTEPTDLALGLAHRGFIWYEIETFGRAAHGSRYNEGIDAILHMGRFLERLEKLEKELRLRPPHPLAGPPSLHASLIKGGSEWSIYPAHCTLQVERRTSPGETLAQVTQEFQSILDELARQDPAFRATLRQDLDRSPFEVSPQAPIVASLQNVMQRRFNRPPAVVGASFWTDAALLADAGIPSVLLGPIGGGLHSAEEWVELESVASLAQILADAALEFCNSEQ
ncbi:MAG: ArgE/DapE family deacylase [Chloroflexota bacterium]